MPHGAIEEVFPDVFVVRSSYRAGIGVAFDRNMTVVRQGAELVVVGSARLTDAGEAELGKLGKVTHVVRVAAFHGADDPYYAERYGAKLWQPADTGSPLASATVFRFEKGKQAETAVLLPVDGGVLITGDSFQNWTDLSTCSWLARRVMPLMGFGPATIGGPWLKKMGDVRADFDRMLELPFKHVIPGHGTVLRTVAKDSLRDAIAAKFS
jgi:hypothetical protein